MTPQDAISDLLRDPEWWFTAVFVAFVVNLLASLIHRTAAASNLSALAARFFRGTSAFIVRALPPALKTVLVVAIALMFYQLLSRLPAGESELTVPTQSHAPAKPTPTVPLKSIKIPNGQELLCASVKWSPFVDSAFGYVWPDSVDYVLADEVVGALGGYPGFYAVRDSARARGQAAYEAGQPGTNGTLVANDRKRAWIRDHAKQDARFRADVNRLLDVYNADLAEMQRVGLYKLPTPRGQNVYTIIDRAFTLLAGYARHYTTKLPNQAFASTALRKTPRGTEYPAYIADREEFVSAIRRDLELDAEHSRQALLRLRELGAFLNIGVLWGLTGVVIHG